MTDDTLVDDVVDRLLAEFPPADTDPIAFLNAQFDAGLAYVHFPVGYGGLDLPVDLQSHVDRRLSEEGAPPNGRFTNAIAAGQGSATIIAYGTEEQKQKYLRPLFTAELPLAVVIASRRLHWSSSPPSAIPATTSMLAADALAGSPPTIAAAIAATASVSVGRSVPAIGDPWRRGL